jgi:hypothetical protein
VRQRQHGVPGGHQPCALLVVALELPLARVELPALQLDHEARLGPVGVDGRRIPIDHDVALIRRKVEGPDEIVKQTLELGPRLRRRRGVVLDQRKQVLEAAATVAAIGERAQLRVVDDSELLSLLVGALKLVGGEDFGEVEEGSLGRADWDVVDDGDVIGVDGPRAVDRDPVAAPARPAPNRDVDVGAVGSPEVVNHACVAIAQKRPVSAGNDGGKPLAAQRWWWRSHEVDAVVHACEPALRNTARDG